MVDSSSAHPHDQRIMRLDEEDLEGVAPWPFLRGRVDPCDPPDPFELAHALGVNVVAVTSRACSGMLVANDTPTILYRPRRDDRSTALSLAHELAHLAMARCGIREHEEIDADEIARRILVPTPWIRVECLTRGRCIEELPALCPLVDRRIVLARARHVLRLDVAMVDAA